MAKQNGNEFSYISEDDYKTLITVYQQKTFKLFNENISLEAKVATLNGLVESLKNTVQDLTELSKQQQEKAARSSRRSSKKAKVQEEEIVEDVGEYGDEETFN
jgi:cell division septum initiation protein DivIVA